MIGFDFDGSVLLEQQKALEAALSSNPKTQRALQKLIRKAIVAARAEVVQSIGRSLAHDPREARRAVRTAVYKKVLGANINIYDSRRAHGTTSYEPPRTLQQGQRGGNRRTRTFRTQQVMHYGPQDRGFILRFVNNGTSGRNVSFIANERRKADRWNHNPNTGNRGNISPRNFFRGAGERALVRAADNLANMIDGELAAMLEPKNKEIWQTA